jgi:tetratricopeptide (TPR) repeat protein
MLHAASGDLHESLVSAQQTADINDAHGFPWGGHFHGVLADLQMRAGDWVSALQSYRTSRPTTVSGTCWDHGDLSYSLVGMANIAPAEFDAIWEQLRPEMPTTTRDLPAGRIQTLLAAVEGLVTLERMDEAAEFYPQVRELADSGIIVQQFHTGLIEKTAAIAAMAAGEHEAAEKRFQIALEQADELPYATEQGEVRRWYAKMLLRRGAPGDTEHARQLLAEAIPIYQKYGMPKHKEMAESM